MTESLPTADLLLQLGRVVRHEEALERYLKECRGVTVLAKMELRDVRLQRKNLTNRLVGRDNDPRRVPVST
jgi:hypothetical protein